MKLIKHLFLDLDNTILDFTYASHQAFPQVLHHFGYEEQASYEVYKKVNMSVWHEFEAGLIDAKMLRAKRFELFMKSMGWKGDGLEWNAVYMKYVVENTKYVDGAREVIEVLSKKFDLHIVTNGLREAQRPRITLAGLDPFISSITVSDEIGVAKPQSEFFSIAMDNAGLIDKSEILMIGDSYRSDIRGGYDFGVKTCWFNHDQLKKDPEIHDFEILNINELVTLLN